MTGMGVAGAGVQPLMMYNNAKDLDIMVKFRHETHKKGEVLAWKCKNSTIFKQDFIF